jgi:CrcB protein
MAALGTGLRGALSTYSTFGYETVRLLQDRARAFAVINAVASIIAGLGAASVGAALAQALIT